MPDYEERPEPDREAARARDEELAHRRANWDDESRGHGAGDMDDQSQRRRDATGAPLEGVGDPRDVPGLDLLDGGDQPAEVVTDDDRARGYDPDAAPDEDEDAVPEQP
jgi:hypothetical protein